MTRTTRVMLMAGMIASGVVGVATAQQEGASGGGERRKLTWRAEQPVERGTSNENSTTHIRSSDGDDQYEVIVKNGVVSATHNGKEIPAERVRRTPEGIEILDEKGNVEKTFAISMTTPNEARAVARGRWLGGRQNNLLAMAPRDAEPPKVMIGITMSTSEEEPGVVVDSVIDGLPAETAGIRAGDRIIRLGDKKIEDDAGFREMLRNHDAGDEVQVTVIRENAEKTFTVKLDAFDGARLGSTMSVMPAMPAMDGHEEMHKSLMESLHKALSGVKGMSKEDHENVTRQLEEALSRVLEDNALVAEIAPGGGGAWAQRIEPGVNVWTVKPGESGHGMTFTVPGGEGTGDLEKKLDKLMKKLEVLERQLDEVKEKLEKSAGAR